MLLRAPVLALLAVTLVGCGSDGKSATSSSPGSTEPTTTSLDARVRGVVLAGPTCPVETAENPCPPAPVAARIDARDAAGRRVARTRTNAKGRYELSLVPGTYTLVASAEAGGPFCDPVTVTVSAGRPMRANISCDTGIR